MQSKDLRKLMGGIEMWMGEVGSGNREMERSSKGGWDLLFMHG